MAQLRPAQQLGQGKSEGSFGRPAMAWRHMKAPQRTGLDMNVYAFSKDLFSALKKRGLNQGFWKPAASGWQGLEQVGVQAVGAGFNVHEAMCAHPKNLSGLNQLIEASAEKLGEPASYTMYLHDKKMRLATCKAKPPNSLAKSLAQDGWATVDSWNLDMDALSLQAETALQHKAATMPSKHPPILKAENPDLPALTPLLRNETLAKTLSWYLGGGSVRYDGHVVLRIDEGVSAANYVSALWHHDCCGRRIKLFVFLHDVEPDGRPTIMATGSHDVWWYFYDAWNSNLTSRFKPSYVTSMYKASAMTGPRGGGFIFDTNILCANAS